jgi:sugar lactone lactonase YvrE
MHPGFDVYVTALAFPEAARWHDGSLWFSDMHGGTVYRASAAGDPTPVVDVPGHPGGLGWLPDGRLLVVSMHDRRLMRLDPGPASASSTAPTGLTEVADLSRIATWHCNDMVVDRAGRAYVGNFGDDSVPPDPVTPATLARVDPDGTVTVAASGLEFPNGAAISPDGRALIVAETRARPARLTRFDVDADGGLTGRRVFARFDPGAESPDGICLDAEGAVWIASWSTNEVVRVRDGGEIVERRSTGSAGAYSCALGGPDGRTLFVCVAATWQPEPARRDRTGRVLAARVDVPGAEHA